MADLPIKTNSVVYFGGDPEIFLTDDGRVVGSEKAIPEDGIKVPIESALYTRGQMAIIRDGVQIELNLPPTHCREWFSMEIQMAFNRLQSHLKAMNQNGKKLEISFRQLYDVDKEVLASLAPASRELGCKPSFNWYHPEITIGVDAATYTKRSAGGHIHFGLPEHLMGERTRLGPLMDTLLGNTSALVDRDPAGRIRREVYGRAGEFRLPRHGYEYRTLSNYWLRSKQLVSMVLGLGRLAVYVLDTSVSSWAADEALMRLVDLEKVERAINTGDVELAKANFAAVREFISRHVPRGESRNKNETSLNASNLEAFDAFIKGIDEGGIERWFPEDPLTHWSHTNWLGQGFEWFLDYKVLTCDRETPSGGLRSVAPWLL